MEESSFQIGESQVENPFILDIDGYEGPLDLLLAMARTQKLDLREISILELSVSYLEFVKAAKDLRIELAADYLVMAAWLAFLKSRLLLPPDPTEEGPSAEDLAAHLAFQLERLAAIREVATKLMARDQLGVHFFPRGHNDGVENIRTTTYSATLFDLLTAYARVKTREDFVPLHYSRGPVLSMEEALERMRGLLGSWHDWKDLASFIPSEWRDDPAKMRSAMAANFAAALQLVKEGQLNLEQKEIFGNIQLART